MVCPEPSRHSPCCRQPALVPGVASAEPYLHPALTGVPVTMSPVARSWHRDPHRPPAPHWPSPPCGEPGPAGITQLPPLPRALDYLQLTKAFTPMSSLEPSPPTLGTQRGQRRCPHFADGDTEVKGLAQRIPLSRAWPPGCRLRVFSVPPGGGSTQAGGGIGPGEGGDPRLWKEQARRERRSRGRFLRSQSLAAKSLAWAFLG